MADNDNMITLKAALNNEESKKQINQDLKSIEKTINQLHLVASLYEGDSKKQLNSAIEKLETKVNVIKLRADFDSKQAKKDVNDALSNLSIKDIKINEQGIQLKARKLVSDLKSEFSKITISPKIEVKKEQLQKQLSSFMSDNSTIQDSSYFSNQAEELNEFFASIDSNDSLELAADKMELFKAEVEATGVATERASNKLKGLLRNVTKVGSKLELAGLGMKKSTDSLESQLNALQNSWNDFASSLSNQNVLASEVPNIDSTIKNIGQLKEILGSIPGLLSEINKTSVKVDMNSEEAGALDFGKQNNANDMDISSVTNVIDAVANVAALSNPVAGSVIKLVTAGISAVSEAQAKAEQAAEEAVNRINKLNSTLQANQKVVSESAYRFAELSQGVDSLTGKNISLNNEDYKEFLSISNELATIFPSLNRTYDENGNAIVDLSGDVNTIVGSLNNLIEVQKNLVDSETIEGLPSLFSNLSTESNTYSNDLKFLKTKRYSYSQGLEDFTVDGFKDKINEGISDRSFETGYTNTQDITDLLEKSRLHYWTENVNKIDSTTHVRTLKTKFHIIASDEDIKNATETIDSDLETLAIKYSKDIDELDKKIQNTNKKCKNIWSPLSSSIAVWLNDKSSYKDMSDALQSSVQEIINNLDWAYLDFSSWEKATVYIQDNILSVFENTDGSGIKKAFNNIFKNAFEHIIDMKSKFEKGDLSLDEYSKELNNFNNLTNGFDDETKKSIDYVLSVNSADGTDFDTLKQSVQNKLQNNKEKVGELSLPELNIANQMEVPEGTLLSWEKLSDYVEKYNNLTASIKTLSKDDVISNIDSLSGGFGSLNKIKESIKSGNIDSTLLDDKTFKDTFSGFGDDYNNFVETFTNSPDDIEAIQSAYNNLLTTWILSSGALDGLTDENAELAKYMLENEGVANADQIVTSQLATTQEKLAAQKYINANASELLNANTAEEMESFVLSGVSAEVSGKALAQLTLKKIAINKAKINTSNDIDEIAALANMAGASTQILDKLAKAKKIINKKNSGEVLKPQEEQTLKEVELMIQTGDFGTKNVIDPKDFSPPPTTSTPKTKTSSTPKKEFDWNERQLQLLNDNRSDLINKASSPYIDYLGLTEDEFKRAKDLLNSDVSDVSSNTEELTNLAQKAGLTLNELHTLVTEGSSTASKQNYLSQVLELDKSLLESYDGAVKDYKSQYDEAIKDIKPEYIAKIENGANSIDTLSGDEAEKVQKAITARDKYTAALKKQYEAKQNYIKDTMEPYEAKSKNIENHNKQLENTNSLLNKQMDFYKSAGEIVDSSFYEKLISNTGDEITNTEALLANKQEELNALREKDVSEDSEEYVKLQGEINDTQEKTYSLKKAQEEYNTKLREMPIDNLSTVISMYKDINSTMKDWASEVEASGEKLNSTYYQSMIANGSTIIDQYKKQATAIQNVMDNDTVGSDNWNKLYEKLQNVNSEMSSMVQNLYKWNEELLKMPMDNINNYSSDLQKIADGLNNVKSEYDTVVNAVTGAISDQIDAINKQKEAVNKENEASQKSLQDKLDLLNKQNEELKLQQTYEQSLYNLQKANQQATEKVIRNGQVVYEQDTDKLREAQEAVQDAKYDLETNKIQSQIDSLQDTLDGLNDQYQDQLDSLQEISDKWSEISDKITQAQNEAKASELLGSNWKNKVLSGNDNELFNNFSVMYSDISKQIEQYQNQIDTTNNIYSLLEDYIASYKDGSITYEQALNGINNLLSQLNQTMTANGNLENIYDYLSTTNGTAANADSLLAGIQQGLTTTADQLVKSLEQYKENSGMISEYTSSWQQLTDNVSTILHVLEEVRDNLENASGDNDDDSQDNNHGAPYMGGDYVPSGPGVTKDREEQHKSGIVNGLVGTTSASKREIKMKLMGLKKLADDEIPAILHKNEAVFTPQQQDTLLNNFDTAYQLVPNLPDFSNVLPHLTTGNLSTTQEINFNGGINIQECNNPDELAQGILNGGLRNAFIQETGKR